MNQTFLFIKKDLNIGGIETFIIRFVRWLISHEYRVIYLMPKNSEISAGFQDTIYSDSIELIEVDFDNPLWIKKVNIHFDENESVLAYTFDLWYFAFLEELKHKYKDSKIQSFYWVPHFKDIFIDEFFFFPLRIFLRKYLSGIFRKIDVNNNIVYVNQSHCDSFSEHYSYNATPNDYKFYKKGKSAEPFDSELALERSKREKFTIITVSRISFPHKAYVLGLVDSFVKLKKKYEHLNLMIVGYGPDEKILFDKLSQVPTNIQKSIRFVGKVEYDELKLYFRDAHLNISVASALSDGAITGLISAPARHYCSDCEVYGYICDAKDKTVSSDPGFSVERVIEEVINMSDNDYIQMSKRCYDSCAISNIDEYYKTILQNKNVDYSKKIGTANIAFFQFSFSFLRLMRYLFSFKG